MVTEEKRAVLTEKQEAFLQAYRRKQDFEEACLKVVKDGVAGCEVAVDVQFEVAEWIEYDMEFRAAFERLKKIVDRLNVLKAEGFLNRVGHGEQKTGKDAGISDCNVKAALEVLQSDDRAKWSPKAPIEKKKEKPIPRIEFHNHPGRPEKGKDSGNAS